MPRYDCNKCGVYESCRVADGLMQELAILRDGRCILCGAPSQVGHHIITRACKALRWSPENIIGLCHSCHNQVHSQPSSKAILHTKLGERYHHLVMLSNTTLEAQAPEQAIQWLRFAITELRRTLCPDGI